MGYATILTIGNGINPFGDGSDGDLHLSSSATIAKSLYQFRTLQIDAGVIWSAPRWSVDLIPVVEIRCQNPIVLDGEVRADGISGTFRSNSTGPIEDTGGTTNRPYGFGPVIAARISYSYGTGLFKFYPVPGGGNAGNRAYLGKENLYMMMAGYASAFTNGDPAEIVLVGFDRTSLVGRDRPFRFCAGGGGSCDGGDDGSGGGNGGGVLLVKSPEIIFGTGGRLTARGGAASTDGTNHDAGGGGGGHVELHTRVALSAQVIDQKVLVDGGAGDANGYAGLDGMKLLEVIA